MQIIPIQQPISKEDIIDKVFIYPTDTCYGMGCDVFNENLVKRVYAIKGREENKPLSIMVDSLEMFEQFGVVNTITRELIAKYLPGDLTIVVPKTKNVPLFLNEGLSTIGIRIPRHAFSLSLVRLLRGPVVTTSANVAGGGSPYVIWKIIDDFKMHKEQPDIVFDGGELPPVPPSTVVEVKGKDIHVVRQGRIKLESRK